MGETRPRRPRNSERRPSERYKYKQYKDKTTAYLLAIVGGHRVYLEKYATGAIMILLLFVGLYVLWFALIPYAIWLIVDMVHLGDMVEDYNDDVDDWNDDIDEMNNEGAEGKTQE